MVPESLRKFKVSMSNLHVEAVTADDDFDLQKALHEARQTHKDIWASRVSPKTKIVLHNLNAVTLNFLTGLARAKRKF